MDLRPRIAKLQKTKSVKRPLPSDDSSESEEEPQEIINERNFKIENNNTIEEPSNTIEETPKIIKFEKGITNRGNLALWYSGYRYIGHKNFWRCSTRTCLARARAEEIDGQYVGKLGEKDHNHLPSVHKKICEEIRSKIKSGDSPSLAEIRANVSNEVYVSLGTDAALQKLIQRVRQKSIGNVNCANLDKIVIPEALTQKHGISTLIYDSRKERGNKDVVLVFSHPRLLNILSQNKQWLLDGTIKLAPKPFVQCLCLGAFVQGHIIICVQALISNKRSFHYEEALKIIKRLISSNGPKKVISDFDKSEISSMQTIFPSAHLSGSLFHFGQSLSQKWKEFGLDRLFGLKTDEGECARTSFRRLLALALVPPQYVRRGFELIANSSPPCISSFIDFFASTYIGLNQMEGFQQGGVHVHLHPVQQSNINTNANFTGLYDNTFQPNVTTPVQYTIDSTHNQSFPEYPIAFWNVNEDVKAKTNNAFQSSHLHFANKSNQLPSMSDFLTAILNEIDNQVDIARSAINFSNKKKVKYIKEQQILNILNEAEEYEDDYQLLNILTLIGLQLTGYIDKLSISNTPENTPSKKKQRISKNVEDSETSLINVSDCPSSSSGLFFKNY